MDETDDRLSRTEFLGRTIGGYRIDARIGSGATGVVFRATHPSHDAPVALKVLHDNLGSITALTRRFEREARVLARLDHENVVNIVDFGVVDGHTFIAMELLEGQTLEQRLETTPVPPMTAIAITRQVLAGLAFAHTRQVVHRDLKPANVFLCRTDDDAIRVKLLDFGLAKMLAVDDIGDDGTLTRKGRIVGTPAYMAPEQITGMALDVRADVYAAGVLFYELLADRRPFLSERRSELLRAHLLEPVPPFEVARPALVCVPELEELVRKALAKDPNNRFADAGAMLEALDALPPDCARIERPQVPSAPLRQRTGTASEVLDSSECRAVSASVSSSSPEAGKPSGVGVESTVASLEAPPRAPAASIRATSPVARNTDTRNADAPRAQPEARAQAHAAAVDVPPRSAPSTPLLYGIAVVLFALAGVLWFTLGR